MDIVLHLGAHRAGSTSFQTYLRGAEVPLAGQGIGFWGPWRTRKGLLHGLMEPALRPGAERHARGRVRLAAEASARRGLAVLLVSDENMLGSPRGCLRARRLYPDAGARVARVLGGFGSVRRAVLQIRSPEMWWASALGYLVARGGALPDAALLKALAAQTRGWREVIADIACALPRTELLVTPFERFVSRPDRLLRRAAALRFAPPMPPGGIWAHRGPDLAGLRALLADRGEDPRVLPEGEGRWMPFSAEQAACLRESYADDLFWLRAGADGLARLTEDPEPGQDRINWPPAPRERGQTDDSQDGRLAQSR
ncbi:hypothetical protein M4578_02390 [Salipiger sp. P9]|uniref:hypothetical protein n=1 Tax=Salipiger pentaromativorans TaxID=2943193 RepID=UPI0021575D09|nr:hypothetical protein [Salipiger pentaromativorans]MCR8546663.1 hypothetical protein [Salipiger pentaromativorans]